MKKIFTIFCLAFLMSQSISLLAQTQQYLHFDRVDDFVEVPEASKFIAGSDQITMAGWFWCDELAYGQGMMAFRNGGTGDGEMYLIQLDNGRVECRLILRGTTYEVVAPNFTVRPEQWQHFAWTYNGTRVSLFVDGTMIGSAPAIGTFTSTDTPLALGDHISPFNFFYGGRIDEFSLWNRGLTEAEIKDMMDNELVGDEDGLQIYYKFNQGVPGGDNQSISELESEVNADQGANGLLRNFALNGNESNFLGMVDQGFQVISFPKVPNKLISDQPFELEATSTSMLDVNYTIVSGPATVSGNTVNLDGTVGTVVVRAEQDGGGAFDPAAPVEVSFDVLDPQTTVAAVEVRAPVAGDVYVPNLGPIPLAAIANIDYREIFSVDNVEFVIGGETVTAKAGSNDHYTGWWTPSAYGTYTMDVVATNNFGASQTSSVTFEVVNEANGNMTVNAGDKVWLDVNNSAKQVEIELPNYVGAFDEIMATLDITCPPGGCDPWDRVSGVRLKGHNGEWYEIIRYITPYGVACNSSIDLTDFMSILHGKVTFQFELGTQGNGFEYTLNLDYRKGTPTHPYSAVEKLWTGTFPFGDMSNRNPTPVFNTSSAQNAEALKLKLVSTGHGWGDNNTGNAAEFHDDTHFIRIDGNNEFTQRNWYSCNPNPDGCNPQNGTWNFNRAGWCPGAIAQWFDYDMNSFVGKNMEMDYVFNPFYTDLCHPNNPNCVNTSTCDCNAGFNPHLIVSSHLISFGSSPMDSPLSSTEEIGNVAFNVFPNPTAGEVSITLQEEVKKLNISIINNLGQRVKFHQSDFPLQTTTIDLAQLPTGVYFVEVETEKGKGLKKVIVE